MWRRRDAIACSAAGRVGRRVELIRESEDEHRANDEGLPRGRPDTGIRLGRAGRRGAERDRWRGRPSRLLNAAEQPGEPKGMVLPSTMGGEDRPTIGARSSAAIHGTCGSAADRVNLKGRPSRSARHGFEGRRRTVPALWTALADTIAGSGPRWRADHHRAADPERAGREAAPAVRTRVTPWRSATSSVCQ